VSLRTRTRENARGGFDLRILEGKTISRKKRYMAKKAPNIVLGRKNEKFSGKKILGVVFEKISS